MVPSTDLDRNFVPLEEIVYTAQNDSSMAPCLSYISVQCGDQNKVHAGSFKLRTNQLIQIKWWSHHPVRPFVFESCVLARSMDI